MPQGLKYLDNDSDNPWHSIDLLVLGTSEYLITSNSVALNVIPALPKCGEHIMEIIRQPTLKSF